MSDYQYFRSGKDQHSVYRIEEDENYYCVRKCDRITFFGKYEYGEYLGRTRSMKDAFSLIKSRSGYDYVKEAA